VALRREEQYDEIQWQQEAACRTQHPAAFFPPAHFERKEVRIARERLAKSICRQCPVTEACLAYALGNREPHGVWGGLNEAERNALAADLAGR
jgi:WhiB family transcriptional regulator, redox-sensing transcriptional regulator